MKLFTHVSNFVTFNAYPQQPILHIRYCIQLMIIAKHKHFRLYFHTWIFSAMKHRRCYKIIHKHIYTFIQLYNKKVFSLGSQFFAKFCQNDYQAVSRWYLKVKWTCVRQDINSSYRSINYRMWGGYVSYFITRIFNLYF